MILITSWLDPDFSWLVDVLPCLKGSWLAPQGAKESVDLGENAVGRLQSGVSR